MIEHRSQKELPPWTEDVWDRWFYSFMKDIAAPEEEGLDLEKFLADHGPSFEKEGEVQ
jgi:hypothetical protein